MKNQAQFNPVPFLRYLANQVIRQGGKIYEQTTVVGVEKGSPAIMSYPPRIFHSMTQTVFILRDCMPSGLMY
jgi:hypothetical protein